jgi:hypothetical protein
LGKVERDHTRHRRQARLGNSSGAHGNDGGSDGTPQVARRRRHHEDRCELPAGEIVASQGQGLMDRKRQLRRQRIEELPRPDVNGGGERVATIDRVSGLKRPSVEDRANSAAHDDSLLHELDNGDAGRRWLLAFSGWHDLDAAPAFVGEEVSKIDGGDVTAQRVDGRLRQGVATSTAATTPTMPTAMAVTVMRSEPVAARMAPRRAPPTSRRGPSRAHRHCLGRAHQGRRPLAQSLPKTPRGRWV